MRLDAQQRSILAFFTDLQQAERAANELKENGFATVQVDEMESGAGEASDRLHNPITGDVPGLANLVLGTDLAGRDEAVLQAADPRVSGMADDNRQDLGGRVLLTVVAAAKDMPRAEAIVKKHGGMW